MSTFTVKLGSIARNLPKGIPMPPLLEAVGAWVARMPHGELGHFEVMSGAKFSDGALSFDANKTIRDATGIFLTFGEGSQLALWNHTPDAPPAVVFIGSEGDNRTVAPTLEAFLEAWSKQSTGTELDGKYLDDDAPAQRHAELRTWLRAKKVKAAKRQAPDFGKWVDTLAKTAKPAPKAGGLPPPPKDMAARAIEALGKPASDPKLAALLAELGIDLAKYKTVDAQRHLLVPKHGYSLSFEKKRLKGLEFANDKYKSWDYVNGKDARFAAFPHEVYKGARTTEKLAVVKKKLGKPWRDEPEFGCYYYRLPRGATLLVSCVDPDEKGGPLPPGAIEYISINVK